MVSDIDAYPAQAHTVRAHHAVLLLEFLADARNVVLVATHGLGKTNQSGLKPGTRGQDRCSIGDWKVSQSFSEIDTLDATT